MSASAQSSPAVTEAPREATVGGETSEEIRNFVQNLSRRQFVLLQKLSFATRGLKELENFREHVTWIESLKPLDARKHIKDHERMRTVSNDVYMRFDTLTRTLNTLEQLPELRMKAAPQCLTDAHIYVENGDEMRERCSIEYLIKGEVAVANGSPSEPPVNMVVMEHVEAAESFVVGRDIVQSLLALIRHCHQYHNTGITIPEMTSSEVWGRILQRHKEAVADLRDQVIGANTKTGVASA
jgi:hypothetical protein